MAKIFVISTAGKDDINKAMMAMNFALGAKKNANATVALMFLGRGVETLLKGAGNAEQMKKVIEDMIKAGIEVNYCGISLKNMGLSKDQIFDGIPEVMGGVETAKRIDQGYSVVSF
ncbi:MULTISPECIES: DsrE family protein [Acidianus]|uniref:Uncharacterized protein n=1 Tax=Candidatus Acidianus copahuensis TaxID=1160895 RepID=A0A031LTP3_9CREN|nr:MULTISPECIES: DsrE family protein [Acidianus]EZQ11095.1 hypothetical protein CM19_02545 [Candidatus Acidianus copahuensis]NON62429.1 hypothetical protein [Acidianus sp. RZ1]